MGIFTNGSASLRLADPPLSTSLTICGWVKPASFELALYRTIFDYDDGNSWLGLWLVGEDLIIESPGGDMSFSSSPAMEEWVFFALTCSGTGAADAKGYWSGLNDAGFVSASASGVSINGDIRVAHDAWGDGLEADFAYLKIWDAVLSEAELLQEKQRGLPVRLDGLFLFSPLWNANQIENYAGNGEDWLSDSLLDTGMPPVTFGIGPYLPRAGSSVTHDLTVQDAGSAASAEAPTLGYIHSLNAAKLASAAMLDAISMVEAIAMLTLLYRKKNTALQGRHTNISVRVRDVRLES